MGCYAAIAAGESWLCWTAKEPAPLDQPSCVVGLAKGQQRLPKLFDGAEGAHPAGMPNLADPNAGPNAQPTPEAAQRAFPEIGETLRHETVRRHSQAACGGQRMMCSLEPLSAILCYRGLAVEWLAYG